jgi:hypothetical protein
MPDAWFALRDSSPAPVGGVNPDEFVETTDVPWLGLGTERGWELAMKVGSAATRATGTRNEMAPKLNQRENRNRFITGDGANKVGGDFLKASF